MANELNPNIHVPVVYIKLKQKWGVGRGCSRSKIIIYTVYNTAMIIFRIKCQTNLNETVSAVHNLFI